MQDIPFLIRKYWAGETTKEERQVLLDWLSTDEAHLEEQLRTLFDADLKEGRKLLGTARSEEILARIMAQKAAGSSTVKAAPRTLPLYRRWPIWAAAALVVILAGAALLKFRNDSLTSPKPALAAVQKAIQELKQVSNPGDKKILVQLSDQSTVILLPKSSISYFQPFDSAKRNISISGKAYFKVAKDPARPFTVFAGDIATTVLGTEFTVSTETDQEVVVRLLNGKVRVHAVGSAFTMPDMDLEPGQEALIDKREMKSLVSRFDRSKEARFGSLDDRPVSVDRMPALAFDRTPLDQVFNRIGKRFHTHFVYNKADVKGLQFTSTFLENDSLPMMVSVICNMNGLSYKEEGDTIVLRKIK